jgi:hypothetical protein
MDDVALAPAGDPKKSGPSPDQSVAPSTDRPIDVAFGYLHWANTRRSIDVDAGEKPRLTLNETETYNQCLAYFEDFFLGARKKLTAVRQATNPSVN